MTPGLETPGLGEGNLELASPLAELGAEIALVAAAAAPLGLGYPILAARRQRDAQREITITKSQAGRVEELVRSWSAGWARPRKRVVGGKMWGLSFALKEATIKSAK